MHPLWRKLGLFLSFSLLALVIIAIAGAVWGALVYTNLKTSSAVPWCTPAMVIALWLMWQYLGGKGWPRSTAASRKLLLRAHPVSRQALIWSVVAGMLAMVALAGLWIVLFQLVRIPPNLLLPTNLVSSPFMAGAIILGASLVAPVTEESAVRGYLQSVLEREFRPVQAVTLSSFVFAIAHITQGLSWPKLLLYFLVGITFGAMAYLNDSILPVIPVHIAGDLLFFIFIWPHDAARRQVWQDGAGGWFWVHVAQSLGFTVLSLLAFQRLARLTRSATKERVAGGGASL